MLFGEIQGSEAGSALRQRLNMIRRMTAVMKEHGGQVSTVKRGTYSAWKYEGKYLILIPYN